MVVSRKLYEDTCPHCGGNHPTAEASLPSDYITNLPAEIGKLLTSIYNKGKNNNLFSIEGSMLSSLVYDSFKKPKTDFTTQDAATTTRLIRDVWHFSAAKNYQELRDLTNAMYDATTEKLVTFDVFKEKASTICEKYNATWLKTEYNFAVAASQNAARWDDFIKDKDTIPFLEYQTVGDSHVRDSHAAIDGVIKHIDNSWWSTHYPPNGWGCRCEVIQAPGITSESKKTAVIDIPPMFRTNLATTGVIFPKGHPYYKDVPRSEMRKSILYLPPQNTYREYVIGNCEIDVHPLHGEKELSENLNAVNTLLKHDETAKIKLLPIIEKKDMVAKKRFYNADYLAKFPAKSADIYYNDKIAEIEVSSGTESSVKNTIRHGKDQSNFVLINIPDNISIDNIHRYINGQLKHYENKLNLDVWVYNKNEIRKYKTKQKE